MFAEFRSDGAIIFSGSSIAAGEPELITQILFWLLLMSDITKEYLSGF